jgi:hypothetical protein
MTHRTQRLIAAIIVLLFAAAILFMPLSAGAEPETGIPISAEPPTIIMTQCDEPEAHTAYFTDTDAILIAKTLYGECRGCQSVTEQACVVWTILNRADAGYGTIEQVITARHQFAGYRAKNPVTDELLGVAYDVLERWNNEKNGQIDVGRVLPADYLWYSANRAGTHNLFRNKYIGGQVWNYSSNSPYVD